MLSAEYVVLYDGTDHRPMGRYLAAKRDPIRPAPPIVETAIFHSALAERVYQALQAGDYTVGELARHLDAPYDPVRCIVYRLMKRDLVAVVYERTIRDPRPGQKATVHVYGAQA